MQTITVGNLIDRVLRDWLDPADDQPTIVTLGAAITDTATSLTYNDAYLVTEEELLLGQGTIIEVGSEQIKVGTAVDTTDTLSDLIRGWGGTKKTSHAAGDVITITPRFTRRSLFDAVSGAIVTLYPRVHRRRAEEITIASGHTEIPADVEYPETFTWLDGTEVNTSRIRAIDLLSSSTGKALLALDAPAGTTGTLIYRAHFPSPTSEAEHLENDLGVLPQFHDAIIARTVAHLATTHDFTQMQVKYLTERLGQEGFQVGQAQGLRNALLRYYEYLMGELSRDVPLIRIHNGWIVGVTP